MLIDSTCSEIAQTWLKVLMDNAPHLLPVRQVSERATGDLHSIGREITISSRSQQAIVVSQTTLFGMIIGEEAKEHNHR